MCTQHRPHGQQGEGHHQRVLGVTPQRGGRPGQQSHQHADPGPAPLGHLELLGQGVGGEHDGGRHQQFGRKEEEHGRRMGQQHGVVGLGQVERSAEHRHRRQEHRKAGERDHPVPGRVDATEVAPADVVRGPEHPPHVALGEPPGLVVHERDPGELEDHACDEDRHGHDDGHPPAAENADRSRRCIPRGRRRRPGRCRGTVDQRVEHGIHAVIIGGSCPPLEGRTLRDHRLE